jgi:cytidine deaminase
MPKKTNQKIISKALFARLRTAATQTARRAYCPYSRFPVGAAVLTTDGRMFSGCNVENASYGLTICAERNAIFQAVAGGSKQIVAVMVYTPTANPSAPCGACRQVINEFGPDAEVYCVCDGARELRVSTRELLKHAFGPENLV